MDKSHSQHALEQALEFIPSMNAADLRKLIATAGQAITSMEQQDRANARAEIMRIAAEQNMTPAQILAWKDNKDTGPTKSRKVVEPKFTDGTSQWTGQGRPPRWVTEWLAAGGTMDDLRIKAAA
jgi:DNA-binding protein H-NS